MLQSLVKKLIASTYLLQGGKREERWFYRIDNLIALCTDCHRKTHKTSKRY